MFRKEGQHSAIDNAAENLLHVTALTDASVVIWFQFVSTLEYWGNKPLTPDLREAARFKNQVEQLRQSLLQLRSAVFKHLCPDTVRTACFFLFFNDVVF